MEDYKGLLVSVGSTTVRLSKERQADLRRRYGRYGLRPEKVRTKADFKALRKRMVEIERGLILDELAVASASTGVASQERIRALEALVRAFDELIERIDRE